MPHVLLVYPEFPLSYWGYNFALPFVGKKSAMPPLGLLTVAGMFPKNYQLKVVDMNVRPLRDADVRWADLVFTSTMIAQKDSLQTVIERCNRAGVPIVAGGPHPTSFHEEIGKSFSKGEGVDHFVLDEVEDIFPEFLQDLQNGTAKHIYRATKKPDVTKTPLPRYDLIKLHDYGSMALQFSRGCPFDCEFCDITKLFGRVPRTKSPTQMIAEFDMLYCLGWRGSLFVVDDNFIGNKRDAMRLLPEIKAWQKERGFPFSLYTEASVNLVEIPDMLDAMSGAGFNMVFLGIESPNKAALLATKKKQNTKKNEASGSYLLGAVRKIQEKGMEVTGGFIIGLDGDTEFDSHITFIQEAGIPVAMAGLLTALKGTNLYHRLEREGRLLGESTGNNTDITLNFVPQLPRDQLVAEYRRVVSTLYDPTLENYFERCLTMLHHLKYKDHGVRRVGKREVVAFFKSIQRQLFSKQGRAYLRFLAKVLREYPKMFPKAIELAIYGYHFQKVTSHTIATYDFAQYLEGEFDVFKKTVSGFAKTQSDRVGEIRVHAQALLIRAQAAYERTDKKFRHSLQNVLREFQQSVQSYTSSSLSAEN
ncbi:MAG: radical SAM protein [Candidatus Ryanbacteria bacterium RIFCSPHIGHO2_02_FULL_45_17b]|uniref:Radical SAM protein n=1 Tax=Candidatus Ryanbacteria bacterium RIFCSPHIGHO2_01_FULL_45_22 TaxID=1802114 RepID=A0A1G2G2V9_9BACT|nr:MAG: radical SAM protein [Candidatus Ryanbacteria bacterium RIFCSPHIGHO2_01_FULL_45_22]OGZ47589.1 MAG: radical SAM protein [Candidatus Ryanbacteria bacterium RIFCSPHIGHO2_02_FULL_45_17b]